VKTDLNDRELFYDGTSRVKPDLVPELFLHGTTPDKVRVTAPNEDVALFNQLSDETISVDRDIVFEPDLSWQLPAAWVELDLPGFFEALLRERGHPHGSPYHARVDKELAEVRRRGLEPLIRTLAFVVYTFNQHRQVWGVGRGSSCASLLLFLIGLHKVDPVKYGIPLEEFFHD
jgi:DNA polymerase III alpha subunit